MNVVGCLLDSKCEDQKNQNSEREDFASYYEGELQWLSFTV